MRSFSSLLLALLALPALAEQRVIRTVEDWQGWTYPRGALEVRDGLLRPVFSRKPVDAALGGKIRGAGTSPATAGAIIDGDPRTGWAPDAKAPLEDWWLELDLGQVLPVQRVQLYFDPDSPPLPFFTVSFSKGERFINSANVVVEGTLLYGRSRRFSFNQEHALEIDLEDEVIRVIRLQADRLPQGIPRLAEVEVWALGDNIALDLIARGGSVDAEAAIVTLAGSPTVMFDGDLVSSWRVSPLAKGSTGGRQTFGDYRIDLGATYWIDTIYLLGEPLGIPPRSRNIYANFLSYQLLYSDGSLAPDGTLEWQELASVPPDDRNLFERRNFHHEFAPVAVRHLRLFYPTSQGGAIIGGSIDNSGARYDGLGLVGEFQVFGQGYPARVLLRSPVIDLGSAWNITSLAWSAQVPASADLLLRSRSGDQVVEETHYYDNKGKEVTQRKWEKLIEAFRGPAETLLQPGGDWSLWSEPYRESGTLFRSPSPRRYLQLELEFLSADPLAAASLERLVIHYARPLAHQAVGEIFPQQVKPGVAQEFSYFLRPAFSRGDLGFDQLSLEVNASLFRDVPLEFREARRDGQPLRAEYQQTSRGFHLRLPAPVEAPGLLEMRFAATLFQPTHFQVFMARDSLRQQVDPGDAVPELAGETDVVSLPVDQALLDHLEIAPQLFTPNGDGRNEEVNISFDALMLLAARPICARVCDLQGRTVRRLSQTEGLAGHYQLRWDGRGDQGQLLPPGIYLILLEITGDATSQAIARTVGLSY